VVTTKPNVSLLSNRRVEKPLSLFSHQLRVHRRVAILLAECMGDLVLVEEVKDVDTHAHVVKVWVTSGLLLRIAVGIVYKMLGLEGTRNRECVLDKNLQESQRNLV
jgi:hypothetical protein